MKMKLVTSNEDKLKEFKRFGLDIDIEKGLDLKEVDGSALEVIIHKAKDAGPGCIVEDTSLSVEGEDIGVNVRWLLDQFKRFGQRKATWTVKLGLNDGKRIRTFDGIIEGTLMMPDHQIPADAFGFDPYFVPCGTHVSLHDLESIGAKDDFSARKLAVQALIEGKWTNQIRLASIDPWKGKFQH